MNFDKKTRKFENYWLTDRKFRVLIFDQISIYKPDQVWCNNLIYCFNDEYSDLSITETEAWCSLVGFFFPERKIDITLRKIDITLTKSESYFHSFGIQLGLNGKLWNMMSWLAERKKENGKWPGGMPYRNWNVSDKEFLCFHGGFCNNEDPLQARKNYSQNLCHLAGKDLREENICLALSKLLKNM
jgi:hypothetical protein